jgi:hypothetical protein
MHVSGVCGLQRCSSIKGKVSTGHSIDAIRRSRVVCKVGHNKINDHVCPRACVDWLLDRKLTVSLLR